MTEPMIFSADETCDVGDEYGSPVTYDYPTPNKFSGEVSWVEIDLGDDAVKLDHLIAPEQRLQLAMGTQ
jgi:hypothetical protein